MSLAHSVANIDGTAKAMVVIAFVLNVGVLKGQ